MKIAKIVDLILEYGFYALFFFTPFLFNPSRTYPSFELFEFSKMVFVYAVAVVIFSAWIARMILSKKIIVKRTVFDLPIMLFLMSQALSTLFSIDRHVSIFGYYSRFYGGLLSQITLTLLYFAFTANRELISLKKLFSFSLCAGVLVALYGILEHFGIDKNTWVQDVQARVFSTLGQPNWLAAYMAILLPLGITSFFIKRKNNIVTVLQVTSTVIFYSCLLFTKSRSGFLGFWIADLLFWVVLIYKINDRKKLLKPLLAIHALLLVINFFLTTPLPQYNKLATIEVFNSATPAQPNIGVPSSQTALEDIGSSVTDSGDIRKIVWKGAIDIVKNYPLFGTGPETFAFAYYKYRPAEHNRTSEWDFLYNRAHNEFLNVAATSGLTGLATYLFLLGTVFWYCFVWVKKTIDQTERFWILALFASYISIVVTNFFGFSVVVIGLFFYFIPAFLVKIKDGSQNTSVVQSTTSKTGLLIIPFILCSGGIILVWNYWIADSDYATAYNLRRQADATSANPLIDKALALRSDEPVYYDEKAAIAGQLSLAALENKNVTESARFAKVAIEASSKALTISPQNVNFWKTRTRLLYQFSALDPSFINNAFDSIKIAEELAPTDVKLDYNEAVILGELNKNDEAIKILEKALSDKPDYKDAYIALSVFYKKAGQLDLAKNTLQTALKKVNPNDAELQQKLKEL
jgi:O-antigen ligase